MEQKCQKIRREIKKLNQELGADSSRMADVRRRLKVLWTALSVLTRTMRERTTVRTLA